MNVFDKEDFSQSEDIVLLIEKNSTFFQKDISPTRFDKFLEDLKRFVENRIEMDYRDRCFLLTFGDTIASPFSEFQNFSPSLVQTVEQAIRGDKSGTQGITWAKSFSTSLKKAIQKCIFSFKQIRNKTHRIVVFAVNLLTYTKDFYDEIKQIVERTAQRLDIIIDIVLIAGSTPPKVFDYENPFKLACDLTGGMYLLVKNQYELKEAMDQITEKKDVLIKSYTGEREYTEEKQFLEIIASDLSSITEMLDEGQLKCNICFKKDCECDIQDSYEHLRKCPNCGKIMHLCCAGRWSEQQNSKVNYIGFPNVFRCPYCFYLLKVPREFVKFDDILYQLQEKWLKRKEKELEEQRKTEEKEKEITDFLGEVESELSQKDAIKDWLIEKLAEKKSEREIAQLLDDIMLIKDKEERISFINYLKFKEGINDNSMPIK